jgi:hypothetical protein
MKLTIEMMSAPSSAARNRSTRNPKPRPCATQLVKSSINALITKMNKPSVMISMVAIEESGHLGRGTYHRACALSRASHAARCVACHGVGSRAVPVALVGAD